MKILAIETSCDETAAAVVESDGKGWVQVLGEAVASSEEMHVKTGGIVPEVAAREQLKSILPVVVEATVQAINAKEGKDLRFKIYESRVDEELVKLVNVWVKKNVDAVAVTVGPGLIGSLLIGVETAKTLAYAWEKPLVPVNHLVAHLYANFIGTNAKLPRRARPRQMPNDKRKVPEFPAIGLVVSGGHTDLVLMKGLDELEWIGGTRDDAAGECLDKCSRLLKLGYPGGPVISAEAEKFQITKSKLQMNTERVKLPRPLLNSDDFDFSFSGLKVAMMREMKNGKREIKKERVSELAWELQEAVVEVLVTKLMRAVEKYKPKSVLLAGGVGSNSRLRRELNDQLSNTPAKLRRGAGKFQTKLFLPERKYCTDNAVMVGAAAIFDYSPTPPLEIHADPSLEIVSRRV